MEVEKEKMSELLEAAKTEKLFDEMRPFRELMMLYECALKEIQTKFEVLDREFRVRYNYDPIESIKTRIKTPESIMEKLTRRGVEMSLENIRSTLFDVAGIRIICSFPEDIFSLSKMLLRQDDITLVSRKDYIGNPKPNGYRSLHLIVQVPIFLTDRTENMCVEVQFRTIAMDFWASLEHKTKYKKEVANAEQISERLRLCADQIASLDAEMQAIHQQIELTDGEK